MAILDYFPGTPRAVQSQVLLSVEQHWDDYDVFVIQAPVASGKSRMAITIAEWQAAQRVGSAVLTPTNVLVEQYVKDYDTASLLKRRSAYASPREHGAAQREYKSAGRILSNYHIYMSHKAYREVVIFDEAHNVLPLLRGAGMSLWQHLYAWPDDLETETDVKQWLQDHTTGNAHRDEKLANALELLESRDCEHVLELTTDVYRGKERKVLKVVPLDARGAKPILWPRKVKKIILMSATINEHDIYDMGLDNRKVVRIPCGSPIPPANRPVVPTATARINYENVDDSLPLMAEKISELLLKHPEAGVVHCTYSLYDELQSMLRHEPRLVWHTRLNKDYVYKKFIAGDYGADAVLVGCGMSEGLDLSYDLARWQCIVKIPYLNLADAAIAERLQKRPESYAWWAVRAVLQATGRVCRTPTDRGWTYILDASFERLYHGYPSLWPEWFSQAIRKEIT